MLSPRDDLKMDIDDRSPAWFGADDYGMDTGPSAVAIVDLACKLVLPTSVVDVGCGNGRFLEEFEGKGSCRFSGSTACQPLRPLARIGRSS